MTQSPLEVFSDDPTAVLQRLRWRSETAQTAAATFAEHTDWGWVKWSLAPGMAQPTVDEVGVIDPELRTEPRLWRRTQQHGCGVRAATALTGALAALTADVAGVIALWSHLGIGSTTLLAVAVASPAAAVLGGGAAGVLVDDHVLPRLLPGHSPEATTRFRRALTSEQVAACGLPQLLAARREATAMVQGPGEVAPEIAGFARVVDAALWHAASVLAAPSHRGETATAVRELLEDVNRSLGAARTVAAAHADMLATCAIQETSTLPPSLRPVFDDVVMTLEHAAQAYSAGRAAITPQRGPVPATQTVPVTGGRSRNWYPQIATRALDRRVRAGRR